MSIYTYDEFKNSIENGGNVDNDPRLLATFCSREFLLYFQKRNKELEPVQTYRYLLTFTVGHKHDEDEVEAYIIKQLNRKPLRLLQAYLVKEYTKKGIAHWHCPIESAIPIKKDRFNYYKKLYGNLDLSRTKAQNLEEGINYTSKDSLARKII